MQICAAIDEYLRVNAEALYTVYSISDSPKVDYVNNDSSDASQEEIEIGIEPADFHSSYEELVPRQRGFVARIWQAARTGLNNYLRTSTKKVLSVSAFL